MTRENQKNFVLLGAAGYIAPRHLQAIRSVGGNLLAAMDPSDSVGILDRYFPKAAFFTDYASVTAFIDRALAAGQKIDYVSICSPNDRHFEQCAFALSRGIDAICEKPLVLNAGDIDRLATLERQHGRSVATILQLRLHPSVIALREKIVKLGAAKKLVDLTYVAPRGEWYDVSWKGDAARSGGVCTNIGIHFFDMLTYVFGEPTQHDLLLREKRRAAGIMEFAFARVRWFLSSSADDLPGPMREGNRAYRSITIDDEAFEFSSGFEDLHDESYREILAGRGYGLELVRPSIEIVSKLRTMGLTPAHAAHDHPRIAQLLSS